MEVSKQALGKELVSKKLQKCVYNIIPQVFFFFNPVLFFGSKLCSETEFVFASNLFKTGSPQEFHKPIAYRTSLLIRQ